MERANTRMTPIPRDIHIFFQADAMTSIIITVGRVISHWKPAVFRSSHRLNPGRETSEERTRREQPFP